MTHTLGLIRVPSSAGSLARSGADPPRCVRPDSSPA